MQIKIGIGTLLAIIFTILKLCKVIAWSWVWVLCPVWIPIAVALLIICGVIFVNLFF